LLVLSTASLLLAAGCGGDDDPDPVDPGDVNVMPVLPDAQSLTIDMTGFDESLIEDIRNDDGRDVRDVDQLGFGSPNKFDDGASVSADSASYSNYNAGRTAFGFINNSITGCAAHPAFAFAGAVQTTPVEEEDGSWTWTYTHVEGWVRYDVVLNGRTVGSTAEWSMTVTTKGRTGNVNDFLWLTGTTADDGLSGAWQVYDLDAAEGTPLVRVDWSRPSAGEMVSAWLNNKPGNPKFGDLLTYTLGQSSVSLIYAKATGGTPTQVEWNTSTTAGSVRLPMYNSGNVACWNEEHVNSSCEQ
jgi:hypothetical protein